MMECRISTWAWKAISILGACITQMPWELAGERRTLQEEMMKSPVPQLHPLGQLLPILSVAPCSPSDFRSVVWGPAFAHNEDFQSKRKAKEAEGGSLELLVPQRSNSKRLPMMAAFLTNALGFCSSCLCQEPALAWVIHFPWKMT